MELDATKPSWPIQELSQDLVLMSYLCGSVPEELIEVLYRILRFSHGKSASWVALRDQKRAGHVYPQLFQNDLESYTR